MDDAFRGGPGWLKELFIGMVALWPVFFAAGLVTFFAKKYSGKKISKAIRREKQE